VNGASAGGFFDAPDSGAMWTGARQSDSRNEPPESRRLFLSPADSGGFLPGQGKLAQSSKRCVMRNKRVERMARRTIADYAVL
jgi:hypothetical protein